MGPRARRRFTRFFGRIGDVVELIKFFGKARSWWLAVLIGLLLLLSFLLYVSQAAVSSPYIYPLF